MILWLILTLDNLYLTFIFPHVFFFSSVHLLCSCRSDHLYLFFIQWSPESFGEGMGSISREPGFMVVKKIDEPEADSEQTTSDWEVALVHQLDINLHQPLLSICFLLNAFE